MSGANPSGVDQSGPSSEPCDPMDIDTDTQERTADNTVTEPDHRLECLICLCPLEDEDKAVFGCGHARMHIDCCASPVRCPLCRKLGKAVRLYS